MSDSTTGPGEANPAEATDVAATDAPAEDAPAAQTDARVYEEAVQVRRSPRFARFMIVGGFIFAIVAFVLTYSQPQGDGYDRNTVFGFMLVTSVTVGVALGAVAALIADRIARSRTRIVESERVDVQRVGESDAD
jgi:uncharacterized membrane protein YcjF (UPF0283 family)